MSEGNIVILAGGSFQGKSLIALDLAASMNFSGVVTSDAVRNVLTIQNPDMYHLSTSTYSLPKSEFGRQQTEVSGVLRQMIEIYRSRGAHVVIEGMHFSADFLSWAAAQDFCNICIDNSLTLQDRLLLKTRTRRRFRFDDGPDATFGLIDKSNFRSSAYMAYEARIAEIHSTLVFECSQRNFHIVEFSDLHESINRVKTHVRGWFSR